jgi:hypothetical protein
MMTQIVEEKEHAYTKEEIKQAIREELTENGFMGTNNSRYYVITGIVMTALEYFDKRFTQKDDNNEQKNNTMSLNDKTEIPEPWVYKMDVVTKNIMGKEFEVEIESDKSFRICYNEFVVLTRESKFDLKSHWRQELSEALKILFDQKIKAALINV